MVRVRKKLSRFMYLTYDLVPKAPKVEDVFIVNTASDFAIADSQHRAFNIWSKATKDPNQNLMVWRAHPDSQLTSAGLAHPKQHPPKLVGSYYKRKFSRPV
jgi:hypothetical protein